MRLMMVLAMLVACGGDSPRDIVDCDRNSWAATGDILPNDAKCEAACESAPAIDYSVTCKASHPAEGPFDCEWTFETDGFRGCCRGLPRGAPFSERLVFATCN